ncbi:hypothetical protein JM946_12085 [Steroidobacter sp. S1-65]|uniref:Uncharacterized protein n=1 Tax=Steroidobacter gossypii TaxID=2805490 RepID=A0ABS1WWZ2_9GAMM|nr:DUF5985 family protein [Steroidobacter gossypii]MBM0105495.1 hypothetical protein [Steroidobacter gossypii]
MIEGFFLGVIVTASLTAAGFFWRFYRQTRDTLFLAFAAAFAIEGINRIAFLMVDKPSEGSPVIYSVRLVAFLLLLGAIVAKNRETPSNKR